MMQQGRVVELTSPLALSAARLSAEHALVYLDRVELDRMIPGLREQWTGAWFEASCADIEVAAFHAACLTAIRRAGGKVRTDSVLRSAARSGDLWEAETASGPIRAGILVNAGGAWIDKINADLLRQPGNVDKGLTVHAVVIH